MSQTVRVNFAKPMALFPLPGTVLLPHAVQPLHISEPRYQQMVEDCLDRAGQLAMANFAGNAWKSGACEDLPELRPAVCVGQIIQHEKLNDGRHNILLHGVCRATIKEVLEPEDARLYRLARLLPLEALDDDPPPLDSVRGDLRDLLSGPRLKRLRSVETVLEWFDRDDVPTHALLELVGFTLVQDPELKYSLLEEANPLLRARLIQRELCSLDRLLTMAARQAHKSWPKGMSWN